MGRSLSVPHWGCNHSRRFPQQGRRVHERNAIRRSKLSNLGSPRCVDERSRPFGVNADLNWFGNVIDHSGAVQRSRYHGRRDNCRGNSALFAAEGTAERMSNCRRDRYPPHARSLRARSRQLLQGKTILSVATIMPSGRHRVCLNCVTPRRQKASPRDASCPETRRTIG